MQENDEPPYIRLLGIVEVNDDLKTFKRVAKRHPGSICRLTLSMAAYNGRIKILEWIYKNHVFLPSNYDGTTNFWPELLSFDNFYEGVPHAHWAVMNDQLEALEFLLDHGTDVNVEYVFPYIEHSCMTNLLTHASNPKCVQLLLDRGVRTDLRNCKGHTRLMFQRNPSQTMSKERHLETVRTLLNHPGVNVNDSDPVYGKTVLHWHVASRDFSVVKLLVEAGADVNRRDKSGSTPLFELFYKSAQTPLEDVTKEEFVANGIKILRWLVEEKGASLNVNKLAGYSLLDCTRRFDNEMKPEAYLMGAGCTLDPRIVSHPEAKRRIEVVQILTTLASATTNRRIGLKSPASKMNIDVLRCLKKMLV